jgi:hypothetical protein
MGMGVAGIVKVKKVVIATGVANGGASWSQMLAR